MANKPFAIQGADLTLGGVNLQAGTTGVVIPGVTQAVNYRVEEVEDTDFDQTITFQSNPVIIDTVTFADWLQNGSSTGRAEYAVEELDNGYIDGIEVVETGSYTSGQAGENSASDLLAYTGSAQNPFSPFVQGDWSEIPFRPRMRAGEVETIGGGGGGGGNQLVENDNGNTFALMNTGDMVFDGEMGGIDRGLVWKYGENNDGLNSGIRQDEDGLTVRAWTTNGEGTYSASVNIVTNQDENQHKWEFDGSGALTFPDGTTQTTAYTGQSGGSGSLIGTWIAVGSNPGGASMASSTDGVNWTLSDLGIAGQRVERVAVGNDRIVYIVTDNNTDNSAIYHASTPGVTPTLAAGTDVYGEGAAVVWREINYLGGKFVATGAYKTTSTVTANITTVALAPAPGEFPTVTIDETNADLDGAEITISGATNTELNGTFILTYNSDTMEPFTGVYALRQTDYVTPPAITSTDSSGASLTTTAPIQNSWPLFAYSTNGVTWTYGDIDFTYFMMLSAYPEAFMSDVAYDGTGYLIPVIDERFGGSNGNPTDSGFGAFYITDITAQVSEGQFISGDTVLPGRFNNIASYADGTFFVSDDRYSVWTSSSPLSTWNQHDYQIEFANQFGYIPDYEWAPGQFNYGPDVDSAVAGTVNGQQMWVGTLNGGQVIYTTDNGDTFDFTTPAPKTFTAGSTLLQGATSQISLVDSDYQPQYDEFVTITVSNGDDTRWNGVYRIRPGVPNLYDLLDVSGAVVDSSAWTVPNLPVTVTFSNGENLGAIHIADNACIVEGNTDGTTRMWRSTNMSTWTEVYSSVDYDVNDIYFGNLSALNTGDITFSGIQIIGDTTDLPQGSIELVPNGGVIPEFQPNAGDTYKSWGQYVKIFPTWNADQPHIHISAGSGANSEGDLFLGDDNKFVQVNHTGQVLIQSFDSTGPSYKTWSFNVDGTTTFPTLTVPISDNATPNGTGQTLKFSDPAQQAIIYGPSSSADYNSADRVIIQGAPGYTGTTGEGGDVYLWAGPGGSAGGSGGDIKVRAGQGIGSGQGGYLNFQAGDSQSGQGGYVNIESGEGATDQGGSIGITARNGGQLNLYTSQNGNITLNTGSGTNVWTLSPTGTTTLPGAVVKSTVAKTGPTLPTTTGIPSQLSGGMTGLGVADDTYGPFTIGGVTFSVTVAGGGISGYINISSTTPYAVNATIGQLTSEDFGVPPGQTTNVGVDAVVQETPTALDLTKSINCIGDGSYTLADGVEGQIMYLVIDIGEFMVSDNVIVTVAHGRNGSMQMQDWDLWPFHFWVDATQVSNSICTLIFTQGHWQQTGGAWD